jgi:hypothetical protein
MSVVSADLRESRPRLCTDVVVTPAAVLYDHVCVERRGAYRMSGLRATRVDRSTEQGIDAGAFGD